MTAPRKHKPGCPLLDPFHPDYGKIRVCECYAPKHKYPLPLGPSAPRDCVKPSLDEYDGVPRGSVRKL